MTEAFQKLGRYHLSAEIAAGGMAVVYRGKLVGVDGFEKDFAIKKILPAWSSNPDFVRMLVDEAKVLVPLKHDNIVQVFELGFESGSHFLVMEYVDGFDLRRLIKRLKEKQRDLPLKLFCYVAVEICQGLEFAHSRKDANGHPLGLVHRDISPQNILVSSEGHVKITDFGIAKIPGKSLETQAGLLKGKFSYMSPEQAMGKAVDEQTDVFALGALLFEMITGAKAFDGDNDFVIWEKVKTAAVAWPAGLDPALRNVLAKALDADKSKRFASVRELRRDIEKISDALPDRAEAFDLKLLIVSLFGDEVRTQTERKTDHTAGTRLMTKPASEPHPLPEIAPAKPAPDLDPTVLHEVTVIESLPPDDENAQAQPTNANLETRVLLATPVPLRSVTAAEMPVRRKPWRQTAVVLSALTTLGFFLAFEKAPTPVSTPTKTAAERKTSEVQSPPEKKTQKIPQPVVEPPAPVFAKLVLKTTPPQARIEIKNDGKTVSAAGFLNREFELKSQTLTIPVTVSAKGFHPQELNLEFSKSRLTIDQTITLKPLATGTIRVVEARPWGVASIAGYGQKAVPAAFQVTEGTHTITVTSRTPTGVKSVSRTLKISPQAEIRCLASFASKASLSCR